MKRRREAAWSLLLLASAELSLASLGFPTVTAQICGTAFWMTGTEEAFLLYGLLRGAALAALLWAGLALAGFGREAAAKEKRPRKRRTVLWLWAAGMVILAAALPGMTGTRWRKYVWRFQGLEWLAAVCWLWALSGRRPRGVSGFVQDLLCGILIFPAEGLLTGRLFRLWGEAWRPGRLLLLLFGTVPVLCMGTLVFLWLDPFARAGANGLVSALLNRLSILLPGDVIFGMLLAAGCLYLALLLADWQYGLCAAWLGEEGLSKIPAEAQCRSARTATSPEGDGEP